LERERTVREEELIRIAKVSGHAVPKSEISSRDHASF
jgi:hypothetical protein